jgi:hypothetical protein
MQRRLSGTNPIFNVVAALLLMLARTTFAQTAKVVPLKHVDHEEVKAKWEVLQKAQKEWDTLKNRIQKDYLEVSENDPDRSYTVIAGEINNTACAGSTVEEPAEVVPCPKNVKPELKYYRKGFENGFEFDSSLGFLVPTVPAPSEPHRGSSLGKPSLQFAAQRRTRPVCDAKIPSGREISRAGPSP